MAFPWRMRIEITVPRIRREIGWLYGGSLLLLLICLLGYAVTLQQPERALLTHARWQALHVHRQTRQDVQRMSHDLDQLARLMSTPHPDPVQAILLAQRVYARQRTGSVATAAARQALVQAAEVAVQVSHGAQKSPALATAFRDAEAKLRLLLPE